MSGTEAPRPAVEASCRLPLTSHPAVPLTRASPGAKSQIDAVGKCALPVVRGYEEAARAGERLGVSVAVVVSCILPSGIWHRRRPQPQTPAPWPGRVLLSKRPARLQDSAVPLASWAGGLCQPPRLPEASRGRPVELRLKPALPFIESASDSLFT